MRSHPCITLLAAAFVAVSPLAAQRDPPTRVGRLSLVNGAVSLYPGLGPTLAAQPYFTIRSV